jgi:DNA-binding transcriptional LysR family regulator
MRAVLRAAPTTAKHNVANDSFDFFDEGFDMRFSLDAIEALDAIERHKSFAAAAKELHKAQSAVSYAIKQLEDALGVPLFDRSGHRALLTDAGRAVLDEGRLLLARARRIEAIGSRLNEAWEARLEVVIDGILPMDPILRALRRLADEGIPTHIQIRVEFLGGVQDRFERGADMMLVKDYVRDKNLIEHALAEVEVLLVAARGHALAALDPVTLDDLQRHVELTVHDSSESKRLVETNLFGGPRVFYLSDFNTKKQAVVEGLGFGWMPRYLIEDELQSGRIVEVAYDGGHRYSIAPVLVHPRDRPLGRAGTQLLSMLKR